MANISPEIDLNSASADSDSSVGYAENDPVTPLAPEAFASDADSADFDEGRLTVAFVAGGTADDQLRIAGGDFLVDEADLYYQGVPIGSILGGTDGSTPLVVTFNAAATPAIAQALIRAIGYVTYSDSPLPGERRISFTLTDGDGGTSVARAATVTVTAADTPPVAQDDAIAVREDGVGTGSLFADNGNGHDDDPDGPALTIAEVNGSAANFGATVVLNSGARLTVNSDGSYSYDPNGKFDSLTDGRSGAVNISTVGDTFTYTLVGGGMATVTVTVNGVAGPGDRLMGDEGDNIIIGGAGGDFLWFQDGGNETGIGGEGNDVFLFGSTMDGLDLVDGGAGTDQIALQGGVAFTFGSGVVGIEFLGLLSGSDTRFGDLGGNLYSYDLTTREVNVAPGIQLVVDGAKLLVGENLTFNGAAESDGSFFIYGGRGVDTLTGGAKNDVFLFGSDNHFGASDVVDGGSAGTDQLALRGSYTLTFGAGQLIGIESLGLLSAFDTRFGALGSNYSYNLTTHDANVAGGVQMTVDGAKLGEGETLVFDGAAETDGSFRIFGGINGDTLTGGQNGDILQGHGGADLLSGGDGADSFRYALVSDSSTGAVDHILDFTTGTDRIDLSRIDSNSVAAGDQAFSWIGSNAFSHTAGELRAENFDGMGWLLEGDTDGNGSADFVVMLALQGPTPLGAGDFIL